MTNECIILAGGLGTRLRSVTKGPKPGVGIDGKPFIFYLFDRLIAQGMRRIIVSVGYKSKEMITLAREYEQKEHLCSIEFVIENRPLGTGGALLKSLRSVSGENAFVLNGDTYVDFDLASLYLFHVCNDSDFTLSLVEDPHPRKYGYIDLRGSRIYDFQPSQRRDVDWINVGVYCVNKSVFLDKICSYPDSFSLEEDFLCPRTKDVNICGYKLPEYSTFIDIGTPEGYESFRQLIKTKKS